MKPVSVILPTYDRKEKLQLAVESVLAQSYQNIELIIVDDGSTDQTEEYVSTISDKRVIYHKLPVNCGVSVARNEGVKLASHDIIAFQDSDDIWKRRKLEMQMEYWEGNEECVLIYSAYEYEDKTRVPENDGRNFLEGWIHPYLLLRNSIGTPTIVMKKNIFEKVGGFDENLLAIEDWDLAIRIAKLGRIGYLDEVLVEASQSEGSLSSSVERFFDARCCIIAKNYRDIQNYDIEDIIINALFRKAEYINAVEDVKGVLLSYMGKIMSYEEALKTVAKFR